MCSQLTLRGTPSATSSPALEAGPTQPDSPSGRTTGPYGPAVRRASRTAKPASSAGPVTTGIYGPTCSGSPVPAGPLCSWESRLRQRLAKIGSTECMLTWQELATPAGRSLSRLVPSTRPTDVTACGLWPTPTASVVDAKANTPVMAGRKPTDPQISLADVVVHVSMWPTPTAVDGARGLTTRPQDTGKPLPQKVGEVLGMKPAGSLGTTEKRGALNPAFVSWIMGLPAEWLLCAPAMAPKPRTKKKRSTGTAEPTP